MSIRLDIDNDKGQDKTANEVHKVHLHITRKHWSSSVCTLHEKKKSLFV